jgi:hypothetical protein
MGRKPKLRGHGFRPSQNYSVQEIAQKLEVAETTVRDWIRLEKLPAMTNRNPHLSLGADISAFLVTLRDKRQRLSVDDFFCMHCREPRKAYGGMADFTVTNGHLGALKALCEVCGGTMSRGVSVRALSRLKVIFDIRE